MKNLFYHRNLLIAAGFISVFFLTSCHSSYLSMSRDYSYKFAWKKDSSAFAFIEINQLYRKPVGIAQFPDGGMSKTVYYDVALYYYTIKSEKLNRVFNFKNYFILYPKKRHYQYIDLAYADSLIFFKLHDPSDFDIQSAKRHIHNKDDSLTLIQIINDVKKIKTVNTNSQKLNSINSLPTDVHWADKKSFNFLKEFRKTCLQKITASDRGIILKDIYPQSEKKYINYIVYKKGNELIRNAILEQIIFKYNEKKIGKIISRMTKYKTDLDKKASSSVSYKDKMKKESYDTYYLKTVLKLKTIIKK